MLYYKNTGTSQTIVYERHRDIRDVARSLDILRTYTSIPKRLENKIHGGKLCIIYLHKFFLTVKLSPLDSANATY